MTYIRYYYVDEAGDLTLFNKKGKNTVGTEGVSKTFMIGVLSLPDPDLAMRKLESLRSNLLIDPRFKNIPSMQSEAKKTALFFQAKNDYSEVRKEVFKILPKLGAKVQVAIRRKSVLASRAKLLKKLEQELEKDGTFSRWSSRCAYEELQKDENIYDSLVTKLFTNILHKADENRIIFARLGKSERREALAKAIRKGKDIFEARWNKGQDRPTTIDVKKSSEEIGLQIIDYYLWALQRLYEKNDHSFFLHLSQDYSLSIDLDDKKKQRSGEWYSKRNPLTLEKLMPLAS